MKRARPSEAPYPVSAQRVVIDVGGTKITTTVSTIQRSTYLAGMVDLAAWEDNAQHTAEIFLDRDPEIFAKVLRLMRQAPHAAGLVPYDPQMCASVIAEADFLGFDGLLEHVKWMAYYNSREAEQDYPSRSDFGRVRRGEEESWGDYRARRTAAHKAYDDAVNDIDLKFEEKNEAYAVERFDAVYGSIGEALSSGVLPKYFLELKPLVKPPSKKIVQLLPTTKTTWFLVGDAHDSKYGCPHNDDIMNDVLDPYQVMMPMKDVIRLPGMVRRVACHALVEDQNGHRWTEEMLQLTPADYQEWMSSQPGDGQGVIYNATIDDDVCLENITGGACRRTMLASDWFEKAVVARQGHHHRHGQIKEKDYWTHLLVAEEPPEERLFSRARRGDNDQWRPSVVG